MMKRNIFALILVLVIIVSTVTATLVNANAAVIPGDVNNDGRVDGDDVIYLYEYHKKGTGTIASGQNIDYNGDGKKDISDATYLLYFTLFGANKYPLSKSDSGDSSGGEIWSPDII